MEKEFVPFEQAVKLKELGFIYFDQFGVYGKKGKDLYLKAHPFDYVDESMFIKAPLWQQVFDWFREKKEMPCYIQPDLEGYGDFTYKYTILKKGKKIASNVHFGHNLCRTACLEKLIEISTPPPTA